MDRRVAATLDAIRQLTGNDGDLLARAERLSMICSMAIVNDQPNAKPSRKRNGRLLELGQIGRAVSDLHRALMEASADTLAAIHAGKVANDTDDKATGIIRKPSNPDLLTYHLEAMHRAIVTAAKADPGQLATKGAPNNPVAAAIADHCAREYHELTGRSPTLIRRNDDRGSPATGPFCSFLRRIYRAHGVTASVEAQARGAIERWKVGPPTEWRLGMTTLSAINPGTDGD